MNENEYAMMSEHSKLLVKQGKLDKEKAEKAIRIFEFLATCDVNDLCIMVDSGAFNEIIKAFLTMTIENSGISPKTQAKALAQLYWIFDEKQSKEVLNKYKEI